MEFVDINDAMSDDLPQLLGTQRQINWAVKIRNKYLKRYYSIISNPDYPTLKKEWEHIIFELSIQHTSAAWWIESRLYL